MGRQRTVLRHIHPDPFGNGKRQKPLYNDLLGTRTFVGSLSAALVQQMSLGPG